MVELLHRFKFTYSDGSIEEHVIWSVPQSDRQPDAIRYRLAYIRTKGGPPAVLYDNHHPKGHHKHIGIHQFPYYYISMEKLIEDFQKDVQKAHENL